MPGGKSNVSEAVNATEKFAAADSGKSQTSTGSAMEDFAAGAWSSFKYSLVQSPLTGATQLIDKVAGTNLEQSTKFFAKPEHAEFGSSAWAGQTVGGTIGGAIPFLVMARVAGPGAGAKMETSAHYALMNRGAIAPIAKAALAGAGYNAIFTPNEEGEDFLTARTRNMLVGSVTWGGMTAASIGLKGLGMRAFNQQAIAEANGLTAAKAYTEGILANNTFRAVMKNDMFVGAAGGVVGGVIDVQGKSLLAGKGFASAHDTFQAATTFALGGAMMGGANIAYEKYKPTSGVKGVRTLEDMTRLAESTRDPNALPRWHYDKIAEQDAALAGGLLKTPDFKLVDSQTMSLLPLADQAMLNRANLDVIAGLKTIRENGPIATMYGSARTKSDTFAYQRGRYTSALLSQEGYTMNTGGAGGIMEAGNRGAYERGGKSIGSSLELPHERLGNGYQTHILKFAEFGPRKQVLREHDVAIVEKGGIGSVDEMAELITHLQTKKKDPVPVYIMSELPYKHFDNMMRAMEKDGLISKGDRDLYKIVSDPRDIIKDLRQRRAVPNSGMAGEQTGNIVLQTGGA
jgi:uncharacterized protein (TIGR00730 family)